MTPAAQTAKRIRQCLLTWQPAHADHTHYTVTATNRTGTLTITWTGGPVEHAVRAHVDALLSESAHCEPGVTLTLNRTQRWSCGTAHPSQQDAWLTHEGSQHLTWTCGCGSTHGCLTHDDPNADEWNSRTCNAHGEYVLLDSTRQALEDDGETFESDCRPGEYAPCPGCGTQGYQRDPKTLHTKTCPLCQAPEPLI